MTSQELEYRTLRVMKSLTHTALSKKLVYLHDPRLAKELNKEGLEEAGLLYKIFIEKIDSYNLAITTHQSKLRNLEIKPFSNTVFRSKLLKPCPVSHDKIRKYIRSNLHATVLSTIEYFQQ